MNLVPCSSVGNALTQWLKKASDKKREQLCRALGCMADPEPEPEVEPETLTRSVSGFACHTPENNALEGVEGVASLVWQETGPQTGVGTVSITPSQFERAYSGTPQNAVQVLVAGPISKAQFISISVVAQDAVCEPTTEPEPEPEPEPEELYRSGIPGYDCRNASSTAVEDQGPNAVLSWTETAVGTGVGVLTITPSFYTKAYTGTAGAATEVVFGVTLDKATFNSITMVSRNKVCSAPPPPPETLNREIPGYQCHSSDHTKLETLMGNVLVTWEESGSATGVGTISFSPSSFLLAYTGSANNATRAHLLGLNSKTLFNQLTMVAQDNVCAVPPETLTHTGVPAYACHSADHSSVEQPDGVAVLTWVETGSQTGVGVVDIAPGAFTLAYSGTDQAATLVDVSGPISKAQFNSISLVAKPEECVFVPEVLERNGLPAYGCRDNSYTTAGNSLGVIGKITWTENALTPGIGFVTYEPSTLGIIMEGTPENALLLGHSHNISRENFLLANMVVRDAACQPEDIPFIARFWVTEGDPVTVRFYQEGATKIRWSGSNTDTSPASGTHVLNTYTLPGWHEVEVYGSVKIEEFSATRGLQPAADALQEIKQFGRATGFGLDGVREYPVFSKVPASLPGSMRDISYMFARASNFNQDISGWNTQNVTKMVATFAHAFSFNQNIGGWNTGQVTAMDSMFLNASAFNQGLHAWCVTNIPQVPPSFDVGANAWVLARPSWGFCP